MAAKAMTMEGNMCLGPRTFIRLTFLSLSPHYSPAFLLQSPIRCYDKPPAGGLVPRTLAVLLGDDELPRTIRANKTMETTANSDQLVDVVYLVALVCLVSLAVVVVRIVWIALFKERKKPDQPV